MLTKKVALIKNNIPTRKPMLTERTDIAWFSRLLRHPARKWSRSILTTQEPARGNKLHKVQRENRRSNSTDLVDDNSRRQRATVVLPDERMTQSFSSC